MSQKKIGLITHCDINYLSRALALIHSLREHGEYAPIHVLCHDEFSLEKLNILGLDGVYAVSRSAMYQLFTELVDAEKTRSSLEFYYLFSPYLLKYLEKHDYEQLVYLDSDLYFFGSLESALSPVREFDVGIVPHRFDENDTHLNMYGVYNVGLVYFKNNSSALKTLDWWAESCLQSTKLEVTDISFGDQKYLEFFESMEASTYIFESHGHNTAPWNNHKAQLTAEDELSIRGDKLLYFHFSGLRIYRKFATLGFTSYRKKPNNIMKKYLYRKYINDVVYWEQAIGNPNRVDYRKIRFREILNAIKYRDLIII
jgi:lipopolysaccharide biosynthesis glycosyltransferase